MKKTALLFIILIILIQVNMYAQSFDPGAYGSLSDYFNSMFGSNPNAGLTAFPVLNIPMGGRSEGMAGAFTAVSDDISFIEYNPAGSSMLARSELGLFHNNWVGDSNVESLIYANRSGDYIGFAGGLKWFYIPFTEYNYYGQRAATGYYSEGVATLNLSRTFFSTYDFTGVSAGINLKGAFRFVPDYTDSDDLGNPQGSIIQGSGDSQSAIAIMADLGLLTRFNLFKFYTSRERNASAALVLRNIGPSVMGDALPAALVAGISYKPIRPVLFAFDFILPINFENPDYSESPYWTFGTSVSVTSFLSMRAGFMGRGGGSRLTIGSSIVLDRIALEVNYSLDLMTQMRPLNRVSLGLRFDLGDNGRAERAAMVDELYLLGLDEYRLGQYQGALYYWEECLRLNPKFRPAEEAIYIIQRALDLQYRIMNIDY